MVTQNVRMGNKEKAMQLSPVDEKCEGCNNITETDGQQVCSTYQNPTFMWKDDTCLGATHVKLKIVSAGEQKVNPLKASKRASRGG